MRKFIILREKKAFDAKLKTINLFLFPATLEKKFEELKKFIHFCAFFSIFKLTETFFSPIANCDKKKRFFV